jgi:hypothetical protein
MTWIALIAALTKPIDIDRFLLLLARSKTAWTAAKPVPKIPKLVKTLSNW